MPKITTTTNDTTATGYEIKTAKTFFAKFLSPTNTKGARVKVTYETYPVSNSKKKSFTYSWDYEASELTYEKAFKEFLVRYETFFFDRQAGERFEVTKSYSPKGYYFTARVAR